MKSMKKNSPDLEKTGYKKYATCRHAAGSAGFGILLVLPSCPRYQMIQGTLCVTKKICKECRGGKEK